MHAVRHTDYKYHMNDGDFALSDTSILYLVPDTGAAFSKILRTVSGFGNDYSDFQKSTAINAGYYYIDANWLRQGCKLDVEGDINETRAKKAEIMISLK